MFVRVKLLRVGLAALVCLLLLTPTPTQAAPSTGLNLQISPLPISLRTNPGQAVSTDLRVRNAGTEPEQLKVTLKKFTADPATGEVKLLNGTKDDTYFNWAGFSKTTFTAQPGEWQTVRMTITPPPSAAFGYYYAVQFSRATPAQAKPGTEKIEGAVAIFVLLDVYSPNAKREVQVSSFQVDRKMYEFLPAGFTVKVKNTGNTHVVPRGNIFISRGSKAIATLEVNPSQGNVLPASTRNFKAQWSDGFPVYTPKTDANGNQLTDPQGKAKTSLKWDFSKAAKLRFGHYTAKLLLIYDNGHRDVPVASSVSFWVVPWRVVGILAVIFLFVAIGLWSTWGKIRRLTQRIKRRRKDETT